MWVNPRKLKVSGLPTRRRLCWSSTLQCAAALGGPWTVDEVTTKPSRTAFDRSACLLPLSFRRRSTASSIASDELGWVSSRMGPCPDTCGWRRTCPSKASSAQPARRCATRGRGSARSGAARRRRFSQPFGRRRRYCSVGKARADPASQRPRLTRRVGATHGDRRHCQGRGPAFRGGDIDSRKQPRPVLSLLRAGYRIPRRPSIGRRSIGPHQHLQPFLPEQAFGPVLSLSLGSVFAKDECRRNR